MKREMGKDGDQGESSKIQRTMKVGLPSAEASLPISLCPEMCMICKKTDLNLKQRRHFQSEIITRTSEKNAKGGRFCTKRSGNDYRSFRNQFQKQEKCYLNYKTIVKKSSSAVESKSEETCLGNDSVLSWIEDNDVFASQQCLSMETIVMKYSGSIGTKQSRIRLMEQNLNSYGNKPLFLQAGCHSQPVVISKRCLHSQCFLDIPSFSGVHRERVPLILGELVLKCIEEAIPLLCTPTIESSASREKQYLKHLITVFKRLLSPKVTMVSSKRLID